MLVSSDYVESKPARTVAKAATGHTIVVEKSTLPVRTAADSNHLGSSQ